MNALVAGRGAVVPRRVATSTGPDAPRDRERNGWERAMLVAAAWEVG